MGSKYKASSATSHCSTVKSVRITLLCVCIVVVIIALCSIIQLTLRDKQGIMEPNLNVSFVENRSWIQVVHRIKSQIAHFESSAVAVKRRNLVLIHVADVPMSDSLDVHVNNMIILVSSIRLHTPQSVQHAFYLFVVVNGESNPLHRIVPTHLGNVGVLHWTTVGGSDLDLFVHALRLLGNEPQLMQAFSAVVCLGETARGPLVLRQDALWMSSFRSLLDANNVGLVGATISCETQPHVQAHSLAVRIEALGCLTSLHDLLRSSAPDSVRRAEFALSTCVQRIGFNLSSVLHDRRLHQPYFQGQCVPPDSPTAFDNPASWCGLRAEDTVFATWGGEPMRTPGYLCPEAVQSMSRFLEQFPLQPSEPALDLVLPETLRGGRLYDLFKQFDHEQAGSGARRSHRPTSATDVSATTEVNSRVCFLVRTASMHDAERAARNTTSIVYGLPQLLQSLLRQDDPHWTAFVFLTDPQPFEARARQILADFADPRVRFVSLPGIPRYTKADAGYTATDAVVRAVLERSAECRWVSATNADNVYGSGVVHQVLASPDTHPADGRSLNMLLNALDSRNFAEQDYIYRREKLQWFKRDRTKNGPPKKSLRSLLLPSRKLENEYWKRCWSIRAGLRLNLMAYVVQPRPVKGRVDLASVFFRRAALRAENLLFGNFTDPLRFPCLGCQDGYLTEYLVRHRGWSYARLPIDGLKSLVFHGPSPTLCAASGNVWFDHPDVDRVGCYSHRAVLDMHRTDGRGRQARYDWPDYFNTPERVCFRLSKHSFP